MLICTSFDTCYYGRSVKYFGKIFYFVQDYEPDFFPKGSFYYLAKSTYNFGFRCITNGQWMAQKVKEEGGNVVGWFQQAYDPLHYYHTNNCSVRSEINKSFKIAVYIRCATARRLSEMLILGLNELGKIRSDFHVIFFGDKHLPLIANFPHNIRDVLSHKQLGDLYRSCDIGCVFSGTNYSIIPIEMMACGLPIVEFDGDNTFCFSSWYIFSRITKSIFYI